MQSMPRPPRRPFATLPALALTAAGTLAALAAPALAGAGAPGDPSWETLANEGEDLSAEQWRALTDGRTVWYRIDGKVWGRESYRAAPGHVTFQFPDGECIEADWSWSEPWFCFDFGQALGGGPPHCFRHVRYEGRLWALSRSGEPQAIEKIDATPLTCGVEPTS